MSNKIGFGLVGAGVRTNALLQHIKKVSDKVYLRGIYDLSEERLNHFQTGYGDHRTVCYTNYEDLLCDDKIKWVIVGSPNSFHRDHIIKAFKKNKHVFGEKPLATTIEDCIAIHREHTQSKLHFATGFVLRYSPIYQKVKELLDKGKLGKIISIQANENIPAEHGGHIMTCWRRYSKISGSHILEKCCHDMDLLNWFIGALPVKVVSFGGCDYFIPENSDNLEKFNPPPGKKSIYLTWDIPSRDTQNPFKCEKDIVDNQVAIMEYSNNVRVTFQTTMNNSLPERRMYIAGTEGNLIVEMYKGTVIYKKLGCGESVETFNFETNGHGGGDKIIAEHLVDSLINNVEPKSSGEEGLKSAVVSLAIEESRKANKIIDLRDIWTELGL